MKDVMVLWKFREHCGLVGCVFVSFSRAGYHLRIAKLKDIRGIVFRKAGLKT